jgi:hypothetical protein
MFDGEVFDDGRKLHDCKDTEASLVEQLSELLQGSRNGVSCEELGMLYVYKYGATLSQVLTTIGGEIRLEDFFRRQKSFALVGSRVSLVASCEKVVEAKIAEDVLYKPENLEKPRQACRPAIEKKAAAPVVVVSLEQTLNKIVDILTETSFLNIDHIVKGADAEVVCYVRGFPAGDDSWLCPLLRAVAAVLNVHASGGRRAGQTPVFDSILVSEDSESVQIRMNGAAMVDVRFAAAFERYAADEAKQDTKTAEATSGTASTAAPSEAGPSSATPDSSDGGRDKITSASPKKARGPFYNSDLQLLAGMLDLCLLGDVEGGVAQLLMRTLDMLRRCRYPLEDICTVVAHATFYFSEVQKQCGSVQDSKELGNVLVLTLFVAHSYALDEVCPLRTWHRYLFKDYCTVKSLNAAVVRLLQLFGYKLRVPDEELRRRCDLLRKLSGAEPLSNERDFCDPAEFSEPIARATPKVAALPEAAPAAQPLDYGSPETTAAFNCKRSRPAALRRLTTRRQAKGGGVE